MANKAGNIAGAIPGDLLVAVLYIGRRLGAIGVLGLLLRLIGWYKSWVWTWVIFLIIGFFSAAILEKIQKSAR